ncbi:MAG TPA: hemerythrin domain-containing protein [Gaiellaceae bacterium]|nr:hemerythrin domain-containing protein [Gaiellaceae bacterium]
MKRHPALIPLSHDHHHGLVQARQLRRAAERPAAERRDAAATFLRFFASETHRHFREEEERFFPLLVAAKEPATEFLTRGLLEHQRLRALAEALESELDDGDASAKQMQEIANVLEEHIRFEERTLFPLIEEIASRGALRFFTTSAGVTRVDLLARDGTGPLWGTETEDLNATLLAWPPGAGPPGHVNAERDVLLVVLAGSLTLTVDREALVVDAGKVVAIPKGSTRAISAGADGVRYLSVHTRRPPLQIARKSR